MHIAEYKHELQEEYDNPTYQNSNDNSDDNNPHNTISTSSTTTFKLELKKEQWKRYIQCSKITFLLDVASSACLTNAVPSEVMCCMRHAKSEQLQVNSWKNKHTV